MLARVSPSLSNIITFATVVVQDLIDHRGAAVGRDVVHQHRRSSGNLKPGLVLED
jgi:hypothetical protein